MANERMKDRVVVIIGGTGGLGASAAEAVVREGGRVVVVGRDAERGAALADRLGSGVTVHVGDATDPAVAPAAIGRARRMFGTFHGLYHVAGGSGRRWGDGSLEAMTDEGWHRTLEWNLTSVMYSNRAALQSWLANGESGSIVNCGSVLGESPSPQHFATHAYAAAKAGIVGLTRSAAARYAPQGIRLNVLAPALVLTPMSERARQNDAIQRYITTKQPLDGGRMGMPADLDGAVLWLLSEESLFVTGQVIRVDGGWTVSEGQHEGSGPGRLG
jgi:NAD(P)-dependent dehydrogenase (short-subunit alcohol dehydrogenase family)